ncbi:MAG TPA: hypothetical protein VFA18_22445 [Gemmataceae bacterium]|jgi:hypothetical protein|nr:hypothetical protein [Gemmataceae bacterium]
MPQKQTLLFLCCLCLTLGLLLACSDPAFAASPKAKAKGGGAPPAAPELDAGLATTGLAVLVIGMLILTDRRYLPGRPSNTPS